MLPFDGQMPDKIAAAGRLAPSGVDIEGGVTLIWQDRGMASVSWSFAGVQEENTVISCEKGLIRVEFPAHSPETLTVIKQNADRKQRVGNQHEIAVLS